MPARRNSISKALKPEISYPLPRYDTTTHTKVAVSLSTILPGEIANMIVLPPRHTSSDSAPPQTLSRSALSSNTLPSSNFHQFRRKHRGNGRKPERFYLQTREEWAKPPYSGLGRPSLTLISLSAETTRIVKREYAWMPQMSYHQSVLGTKRSWNAAGGSLRTMGNERVWAFAILLDLEIEGEKKDLRLTLSAGSGQVKLYGHAWGERETRVWWVRRETEEEMEEAGEEHRRFWEIMDVGRKNRQIRWREIHVDLEPESEGGGWANLYRAELAVYVC